MLADHGASQPLPAEPPWLAVMRLIERAPSIDGLQAHRLDLIAARHFRSRGLPVPPELAGRELGMEIHLFRVRRTLAEIRSLVEGELVLFKGLALATRYPSAALRPFADIDLLVRDPQGVWDTLRAAGFVVADPDDVPGSHDDVHHLPPLLDPSLGGIEIEIHRHVSWVPWGTPPTNDEIFRSAKPAEVGVAGILEPAPAHHAVIVAAHSANEVALQRAVDLLDIALLLRECNAGAPAEFASRHGVGRIWRLYQRAVAAELLGALRAMGTRPWTTALRGGQEPSIVGNHVARFATVLWTRDGPLEIIRGLRETTRNEFLPQPGESSGAKRARIRAALARPRSSVPRDTDAE